MERLDRQYKQKIYDEIPDIKVIYYILTGLTYRQIGIKFYSFNTNKFIYQVRKLLKQFNLSNRSQLAYFAVKNDLINAEILEEYINA